MKSNSYNILFNRIECANSSMNGKWIPSLRHVLTVLGKKILLPGVLLLAITLTFANKSEAQGSLSLDGQSYAEAATSTDIPIGGDAFAIEFWIKHDGKSDQNSVIFTKGASGDAYMYSFRFKGASDNEELPIVFSTRFGENNVVSHSGVPARRWTHVAVSYDGNQLALYINGELDATSGFDRTQEVQDKPLVIGANNGRNSQFFSGEIDNLRFWNINRTFINIKSDLYNKLTGTESGLLALYHFDSHSNGEVVDQAGSHTLNMVNNARIQNNGGADIIPPDVHAKSGNQEVYLNWKQRLGSNYSNGADEVEIYRSIQPPGSLFTGRTKIATVNARQVNTYRDVDEALLNGAVYYYQVRSVLSDGSKSDYSSFVAATPYDSLGGGSLKLSGAGYGTVTDRPSLEIQNQPESNQEHTEFTIETWVKHDGQSDKDGIILTKGNNNNSSMYQLKFIGPETRPGEPYRNEEPRVQFSVRFGTGVESISGIPRDRWTHIAAVYDGNQLAIYLDGELDATKSFSRNLSGNDHPLRLGTNNSANEQFFSGRIDELRHWNDARTEQEIKANYRNQLEGTENGLMSYWQFNDTGSTIPVIEDGFLRIKGAPKPLLTNDLAKNHSTVKLAGDAVIEYEGIHPVVQLLYAQADSNHVNLEWSKRKSEGVVGYKLYRSSDIDGTDRRLLTTFPDTSTYRYVDNSVDTNTTYYYEMSVMNSGGVESDYVHPAGVTTTSASKGYALTLDNSNNTDDYATVENRPSINFYGTQLTVEAWIKFNSDSDEDATILTKGTDNNSSMYRFRLVGTGTKRPIAFDLRYGSGIISNDTLMAGQWYHIAGTYDGSRRNLYINGELSNQGSFSRNLDGNSNPLRFGTHNSANEQFFSGQIDEVRLWSDARTQEEIRNHYQNELMGNETGLKAYWRFNELNNTGITSSSAGRPKTAVLANNASIAVSVATEVEEITSIEDDSGIPDEMALKQNYPNPFNPSTNLRFDLTESRKVTLAIYNTLGRRVKTLIAEEQMSAGKHNIRFEAGNLPSGVYFYTIQAGDFKETNKMILMK